MVCAQKARLIGAYAAATESLAVAMAKLRLTTSEEFTEDFAGSKAARAECNEALDVLLRHRAEHGC